MARILKYTTEEMEECETHREGKGSEDSIETRTQELRRDIDTLDTRLHAEHRRIQSMMKDLTGLWDILVLLEKESR